MPMVNKILIVVIIAAVVALITSWMLYAIFESMGLPGYVGIMMSIAFILFIAGGVIRAIMRR